MHCGAETALSGPGLSVSYTHLDVYKRQREFRSFFHGMLGYVLTAFLVASSGLYFLARCLIYGLTDFSSDVYKRQA